MSDINELERKWVLYRRKRLLKFISAAFSIVLILGIVLYFSLRTPSISAQNDVNQSSGQKAASGSAPSGNSTKVAALKPEVPSVADASANDSTEEEAHERPRLNIRVTDLPVEDGGSSADTGDSSSMEAATEKRESVIKEMENRFALSKDYDEALYIARYYYAKKQYKKSEEWAMKANAVDSTQEDSWIIFGKAKARQGDRAEALKVLQAYYDHTGSTKVGDLIDKIRKGRPY